MCQGVNGPLRTKWPDHFEAPVALIGARAHALTRDRKETPNAERGTSKTKSSWEATALFDSGF